MQNHLSKPLPNNNDQFLVKTDVEFTQPRQTTPQVASGEFSFELTLVDNGFDNACKPYTFTFNQFRDSLLCSAQTNRVNDKHKIGGVLQSSFYPLSERQQLWDTALAHERSKVQKDHPDFIDPTSQNSKSEIFAKTRSVLFLDFDKDPDINHIRHELIEYYYIAYTSHSHKLPGKGERWRVCLFLDGEFTKNQWHHWGIKDGLKLWCKSLGEFDTSCLTFAQFQKEPAINPVIGNCEIYVNEGPDKKLVPAKTFLKQPEIPKVLSMPDVRYATTLQKRIINQLIINKCAGSNRSKRFAIAQGLQELGYTRCDFEYVDSQIKNYDATTPAGELWDSAIAETKKYTRLVSNLVKELFPKPITKPHPTQLGEVYPSAPQKWDVDTVRDGYVTLDDFDKGYAILFNGSLGIGKNKLWEKQSDCLVLVPLLNILKQGQSNNTAGSDHILTYNQSDKVLRLIRSGTIDPQSTTLVIDEFHNFLVSRYRSSCLHAVKKLLEFRWKKIICQTGTCSIDDFDHIIQFDRRIKLTRKDKAALVAYCIHEPSKTNALSEALSLIQTNPVKTIVLINNKQKLAGFGKTLENAGIKHFIATSETVKESHTEAAKMAISAEYTMSDYQVLMGTATIVEGISIKDDITVGQVIVIGNESPQVLQQICGRLRLAKHINLYVFGDFNVTLPTYAEWDVEYQKTKDINWQAAIHFNSMLAHIIDQNPFVEPNLAALHKIFNPDLNRYGFVYDKAEGEIVDSGLGEGYKKQEWQELEFYADRTHAITVLEQRGFQIGGYAYRQGFKAIEYKLSQLYAATDYDTSELERFIASYPASKSDIKAFIQKYKCMTSMTLDLDELLSYSSEDLIDVLKFYDLKKMESWDQSELSKIFFGAEIDAIEEAEAPNLQDLQWLMPEAKKKRAININQIAAKREDFELRKEAGNYIHEILATLNLIYVEKADLIVALTNGMLCRPVNKYVNLFITTLESLHPKKYSNDALEYCIKTIVSSTHSEAQLRNDLMFDFSEISIRSDLRNQYRGKKLTKDEQLKVLKTIIEKMVNVVNTGDKQAAFKWVMKRDILAYRKTENNSIFMVGDRIQVQLTRPSRLLNKILPGKLVRSGKKGDYLFEIN